MKIKYLPSFLVVLSLIACNRTEDQSQVPNPINASNLGELTIDDSFNWSSSKKGFLQVTLKTQNDLLTEGQYVNLIDESGIQLASSQVQGEYAEFYYNIPQKEERIFLYYPNTDERIEILNEGSIEFSVGNEKDFETISNSGKKSSFKTSGAERVANGDFSVSNLIQNSNGGNFVLVPSGTWYKQDTDGQLTTINGNSVYQGTSPSAWALINQSFPASPNASYTGSYDYYRNDIGRYTNNDNVGFVFYFDSNGGYLGNKSFVGSNFSGGTSHTGFGSVSGTTPANCAYVQIGFAVRDNDWVDNVSFDVAGPSGDDDGDGVSNINDDFPNDILRAYATDFPTSGYQTLAFEDLWPAKGDFDFNDMVISNQVEFTENANNELVDATFTISLDAVGSGFSNGLAVVLLDGSKNNLNQNIISSVGGDASVDPNVSNGIIVFDDVYAAQDDFYQNNGDGPSLGAKEFSFTVSFVGGITNQTLLPDFYIFRKGERGREIHLNGFVGTSEADITLYNTLDDSNGSYTTSNGLPWVIEVISSNKDFQHPIEKIDILQAYPNFQAWAESNGASNSDWYNSPASGKVY